MKPHFKLPLLFLLFFVFQNNVIAQAPGEITGYYINSVGDTINGSFPNYREWSINPDKVQFKPTAGNEIVYLTSDNCNLFHVNNYDTYIRYAGTRMTNPIEFHGDAGDNDSTNKYQTVATFLRVVFNYKGFKILLFKDKIRPNFFYQFNDSVPIELIFKSYSTTDGGVFTDATYRQQLVALFSTEITNKKLEDEVDNLFYDENSVAGFMRKVYGAPKENNRRTKYKNTFFINAGVAVNFLKVVGDPSAFPVDTKYNEQLSPALTIGMYIPSQRNFGRLGVSPQLSFSSYINKGNYSTVIYNQAHYAYSEYKVNLLIVPRIYATYKLVVTKNIDWNVGAGIGYAYASGAKETTTDSTYYTTMGENTAVNAFPSFDVQTALCIGNSVDFLLDYMLPSTVNSSVLYTARHSSLQFTVGYKW